MPIPSLTKEIPSRRTVRSDFSVVRAPVETEEPVEISILAHVHSYPPYGLAGAPLTLHHLLKHGLGRGWKPRVVVNERMRAAWVHEGVPARNDFNVRTVNQDYSFSQVVITHLGTTRKAIEMSRRAGRPLVHLVHNENQLARLGVQRRECALAIFNSHWLQERVGWEGPSVVAHPYTPLEDYATDGTGDAVTLVNLTPAKGVDLFFELARRNPGVKFLGVTGSYGIQAKAPADLHNLEIMGPQVDMKNVYSRTRLLVMPSHHESWGRTALEAACSGIPTICSDTPGLREAGVGAALLDLDFEKWNKAVRRFTRGEKAWTEASQEALAKVLEWESVIEQELDAACSKIEGLI